MHYPSRAIALYGTDELVTPPRVLQAGKLSAELDAGNLRYIRWNGEEVLRAISFIIRDKDWGTYNPVISDLTVEEGDDGFRVTLHAHAADAEQSFAYDAVIEGHADGRLAFHGSGQTEGGFLTNRTGFVILHPIDGVAGAPVTIEHTEGRIVEAAFPEIIDPVQPMMGLRALTHRTPGGVQVRTLMEGDTYEMEDQRNWTDASYKTYVRPLALPWPYRIGAGEGVDQRITLTLTGAGAAPAAQGAVTLTRGATGAAVPPLGLGLRPEDTATAADAAAVLRQIGAAHVILHHDPRAGHGRDTLAQMLGVARAIGAEPWLEAVIAHPDDAGAAAEVAALGALASSLDHPFATVLVSPAPDLKCTLPGSAWPPAPDAGRLYESTRAAFPGARIGGGMFSYFTELNRKRPPVAKLDLVSFTTSPMVHAGDDRSVMETREAYPAIVSSVSAIAVNVPWAVGPSAIGVRDNPYGAAAKDNPANIRQAMNWNDPRQRGLLGAVWALGYFAQFAQGGAAGIALGAGTGPFGAVSAPASYPRPWFDEFGSVYPIFHVLRGLGRLCGAPMVSLDLAASAPVVGFAAQGASGLEIWVGNARPTPVPITLRGGGRMALLDAGSFAAAAQTPAYMDTLATFDGATTLDGFAIARILTEI
ncbi:MAG: hypothetical protein ACOH2H_26120 [Cypionkella sp.]